MRVLEEYSTHLSQGRPVRGCCETSASLNTPHEDATPNRYIFKSDLIKTRICISNYLIQLIWPPKGEDTLSLHHFTMYIFIHHINAKTQFLPILLFHSHSYFKHNGITNVEPIDQSLPDMVLNSSHSGRYSGSGHLPLT